MSLLSKLVRRIGVRLRPGLAKPGRLVDVAGEGDEVIILLFCDVVNISSNSVRHQNKIIFQS